MQLAKWIKFNSKLSSLTKHELMMMHHYDDHKWWISNNFKTKSQSLRRKQKNYGQFQLSRRPSAAIMIFLVSYRLSRANDNV